MKTFLALLCIAIFTLKLDAGQIIEITEGQVKPEPISLVSSFSNNCSNLATDIDRVIANDLESCGLFELMNPGGFLQKSKELFNDGIRYNDWHITKTRFVYFASIGKDGSNLTVKFQLHDIIRGQRMLSLTVSADEKKWRRMAHMIADAIYTSITGETGFFNTQIAFVEPTTKRGRDLNTCVKIMDIDGDPDSITKMTDGNSLVLTPRYSPDGKSLVYVRIDKNTGEVYIIDRVTKVSRLMGRYKGLNFAPRYSPDGKKIVFSIAKGTTTAVYEQNLLNNELKQLTQHNGIDTSPGYSPNGKKIVFVSDREGKPQLFKMNTDGSKSERISFQKGTYTQPCWSPRGDLIAYTFQKEGRFFIGVMKPDGTDDRLISTAYLVEDPTWTSNGRYLIFTVQHGVNKKQKVMIADLTGQHQYIIKSPGESFGASLSPLLGGISK